MGAFAFNLELEDGTPADPPTLKAAVPELEPATRSRSGGTRCSAWSTSDRPRATTMTRCWSLRTWPEEPSSGER